MITLLTSDLSLAARWTAVLRMAGREYSVIDSLQPPQIGPDGGICLIDLGPRGVADLEAILAGIAARPLARFAVLTARPDPREGLQVLRAGARGYCNRLASPEVAAALVTAIESGEIWAGRQVTEFLLGNALGKASDGPGGHEPALLDGLTPREVEIASQVAAGLTNKVIAAENGISERTVKVHLNNIYRKTGLSNRVQLALALNRVPDGARKMSNG